MFKLQLMQLLRVIVGWAGGQAGRQRIEPRRCKTFSRDASIHETVRY